MSIPIGAKAILDVRKRGKRPASEVMILTNEDMKVDWSPVVYANVRRQYDWVFLKDLQSIVVVESTAPYNQMFADIAKVVGTKFLRYWFTDVETGGYVTYLPEPDDVMTKPYHRWQHNLELCQNMKFEDRDWAQFMKELVDAAG